MKRIAVVFLVAVLSGCAQKKIFTKSGFTQAEWEQDLAQCQYEAASSTQGVDYSYQTVFGQSLDQALRRRDLVELCLRAKGYVEQKAP